MLFRSRSRLVINLTRAVGYTTQVSGNTLILRIGQKSEVQPVVSNSAVAQGSEATSPVSLDANARVVNVDFRRGELGEGQIQIMLSDPKASANITREGKRIVAELANVQLPENLSRRLDVVDFSTPVRFVDANTVGKTTRIVIEPINEDFEYLAYQTDKLLSINVTNPPAEKKAEAAKKFFYTGEKLSLNFQNIEVRSVLQLIADFTGLNLVASDSVQGNITRSEERRERV